LSFDPLICRWTRRAALLVFVSLAAASGGCRQGPWALWNAYSGRFIDEQGRVIEHSAGDRTTSEGQAYALFFSLADNDRARFVKLLDWTRDNLASSDIGSHLPGWQWGKSSDGQWKLLDANPAADADCWMAYSLVEAGRLWKNPAYAQLGRQMMAMIARQEVVDLPGFGSMLMPGTSTLWVHGNVWTLNPSYVPLFLFQRFAQVDPGGPWGAIAMNIPRMLRRSARRGFAMDWVEYVPNQGFSPAPAPGAAPPADNARSGTSGGAAAAGSQTGTNQGPMSGASVQSQSQLAGATQSRPPLGSYDAIRVYLWAGMIDRGGGTRAEVLNSLSGMGAYLSNPDHTAPPEKVNAEGMPESKDGPVGFSAAVLPYLWAIPELDRAAAQLRVRMSAQLNPATGLYGNDPVYYDQNLALFALGYLDGRFHFGPRGELKVEWIR